MIAGVYSGVEREVYIKAAAERLGLGAEAMKNDVDRARGRKLKEYKQKQSREVQMSLRNYGDRVNPDAAKNIPAAAAEEAILGLMLLYEEYRSLVAQGKVSLCEDDFYTAFGKKVFAAIMETERAPGGFLFELLGETFSPDEMARLVSMQEKRRVLSANGRDVFESSIAALRAEMEKEKGKSDSSADFLAKKRQALLEKKQKSGI